MLRSEDLLFGVLVPALVCGLVLASVWWRRAPGHGRGGATAGDGDGRAAGRARARIAGAWALGFGYLAAHVHLFGAPALPEAGRVLAARDWIPWVVGAGLLLAALEALPV